MLYIESGQPGLSSGFAPENAKEFQIKSVVAYTGAKREQSEAVAHDKRDCKGYFLDAEATKSEYRRHLGYSGEI